MFYLSEYNFQLVLNKIKFKKTISIKRVIVLDFFFFFLKEGRRIFWEGYGSFILG
jgi:hypothetical protein